MRNSVETGLAVTFQNSMRNWVWTGFDTTVHCLRAGPLLAKTITSCGQRWFQTDRSAAEQVPVGLDLMVGTVNANRTFAHSEHLGLGELVTHSIRCAVKRFPVLKKRRHRWQGYSDSSGLDVALQRRAGVDDWVIRQSGESLRWPRRRLDANTFLRCSLLEQTPPAIIEKVDLESLEICQTVF